MEKEMLDWVNWQLALSKEQDSYTDFEENYKQGKVAAFEQFLEKFEND